MKNLGDTILFSLCVVFFVIGVHQTMVFGIEFSYFIFMLSLGMLFLVRYRRMRRKDKEDTTPTKRRRKP
ncbi:hypothetical protein [Roseivirga pacifica]|uniref:hypothetical protein n=1 Tax=Roseivirga pacifica TaxID=1267423 RepID=UPI003BB17A5E